MAFISHFFFFFPSKSLVLQTCSFGLIINKWGEWDHPLLPEPSFRSTHLFSLLVLQFPSSHHFFSSQRPLLEEEVTAPNAIKADARVDKWEIMGEKYPRRCRFITQAGCFSWDPVCCPGLLSHGASEWAQVRVTEVLETDQMPCFSLSWCVCSLGHHRLLRFWALAFTWRRLEWQSISWQGPTNGRYSEGSSSQERFTEHLCVGQPVAGLGVKAEDGTVPALERVILTGQTDPQTDTFSMVGRCSNEGGARNGRAGNGSFTTSRRCFQAETRGWVRGGQPRRPPSPRSPSKLGDHLG